MHRPSRYQLPPKEAKLVNKLAVLPSRLIGELMTVPASGQRIPLSYEGRPYLRRQIDSFPQHPRHLYLYGRQSEKSTSISAQINAYTTVLGLTWQYVSATMEQATEFSQWKLDNPIRDSEILSGLYDMTGSRRPYNIKRKENYLGGRVLVGTAYGDAARIRGNPADGLSIDEIALVDLDAIGILRECIFHSDYSWEIHAGTPLSTDNPLWILWSERSQQHEWGVPCERHSPTLWNILGPKNLSPRGLVCERCREPIDTRFGQWIITSTPSNFTFKAFRIPQIATTFADFDEIYRRLVDEPVVTMRESFAYSVEEASEVFSDSFLETIADRELRIDPNFWYSASTTRPMYAGIDWAQPDPNNPNTRNAATVLSLGCYLQPNVFSWIAAFRWQGDPDRDLDEMCEILDKVNAHRIVADHGAGYQRNIKLMHRYGYPKFMVCKYNRQNDPMRMDPKTLRINVNRNEVLDMFSMAIKMNPHKFSIPRRADMERVHWWQDLRAVLIDSDKLGNPLFVKRSGRTDDHFHGMFYSFLASHMMQPRVDVLSPIIVRTEENP